MAMLAKAKHATAMSILSKAALSIAEEPAFTCTDRAEHCTKLPCDGFVNERRVRCLETSLLYQLVQCLSDVERIAHCDLQRMSEPCFAELHHTFHSWPVIRNVSVVAERLLLECPGNLPCTPGCVLPKAARGRAMDFSSFANCNAKRCIK